MEHLLQSMNFHGSIITQSLWVTSGLTLDVVHFWSFDKHACSLYMYLLRWGVWSGFLPTFFFLTGYSFSYCWVFKILYIFYTLVLYQICLLQILSPSLWLVWFCLCLNWVVCFLIIELSKEFLICSGYKFFIMHLIHKIFS